MHQAESNVQVQPLKEALLFGQNSPRHQSFQRELKKKYHNQNIVTLRVTRAYLFQAQSFQERASSFLLGPFQENHTVESVSRVILIRSISYIIPTSPVLPLYYPCISYFSPLLVKRKSSPLLGCCMHLHPLNEFLYLHFPCQLLRRLRLYILAYFCTKIPITNGEMYSSKQIKQIEADQAYHMYTSASSQHIPEHITSVMNINLTRIYSHKAINHTDLPYSCSQSNANNLIDS